MWKSLVEFLSVTYEEGVKEKESEQNMMICQPPCIRMSGHYELFMTNVHCFYNSCWWIESLVSDTKTIGIWLKYHL